MLMLALLLLLACPLSVSEGGGAVFSVETADGATFMGEWLQFDEAGSELATASGRTRLAQGELVLVSGQPAPLSADPGPPQDILLMPARPGSPGLGDRLVGRFAGGDDVEVRFLIDGVAEVAIPFEHVDRLLPAMDSPLDRLAQLQVQGFDDRVWQRRSDASLDAVAGVIAEVSAEGLVLESALGDLELAWHEVLAVALADTIHPGRELQGWPVRMALRGGSVFAAGLVSVSPDQLVVNTQFAEGLVVLLEELSSMVLSDRSDQPPLLLADQSPVEVDEWPSLGRDESTLFPWQRDLAVAGDMLALGGLPRVTGLGVHAHSTLVFSVPADAQSLRVTAGLSDDVFRIPAQGSVSFEVRSQGQALARVVRHAEGDAPVVLQISGLSEGQLLEFMVGDGGDLDAGDRAVWVDGVFGR